jgi:hypothetical protein
MYSWSENLPSTAQSKSKGKGVPRQAEVAQGVKSPDFLDFLHYECGNVVTLTHRPSLPPIFRGWVDPRAHGSVGSYGKNHPATPLGIDPETLRLVAQCLNYCSKYTGLFGSTSVKFDDKKCVSGVSTFNSLGIILYRSYDFQNWKWTVVSQ